MTTPCLSRWFGIPFTVTMSPRRRPGKRIIRSMLPILLILAISITAATIWTFYRISRPQFPGYLLTPERFAQVSARGVKATEESWLNHDGTSSHGWLLKGSEGSPAILLIHQYDADRSWYLNLGVKLNEQTNFTILMPDLRGHGENPAVKSSTFGILEGDDVRSAVEHLRTLKSSQGQPLIAGFVGYYGVGMGAYAALKAATSDPSVKAIVLDSIPATPEAVFKRAERTQLGIDNPFMHSLARLGVRVYLGRRFDNTPSCNYASEISGRGVLLLAGEGSGNLRGSTQALQSCFATGNKVELQDNLPLTGNNLHPSTGEQEEAYDRRVIDFFDRNLRPDQ